MCAVYEEESGPILCNLFCVFYLCVHVSKEVGCVMCAVYEEEEEEEEGRAKRFNLVWGSRGRDCYQNITDLIFYSF